jgi:hypothetical protein
MTKARKANNRHHSGTFETRGGRTYLENLQSLAPTELTKQAIEKVQKDDAARAADEKK